MTLGANIKAYRVKNDMYQSELAKRLNVSKQTISSWETNRTEPNIGAVERMAQIFGCSKLDIIGQDYVYNLEAKKELTMDELELLRNYRRADEETRNMVKRLLAYYEGFKELRNESSKIK